MVTRTVPRTAPRSPGSKSPNQNALQALRDVLIWSQTKVEREPRSLFTVAFGPAGALLGMVSAVSLVTLVSSDSDLQGAFGAIALVWLAAHQVPVSIADVSLGAMPLAPTALAMFFVARVSYQAAETRPAGRELRQVLAAAMSGPLVITMVLLATAKDAATVVPLNPPAPAPALAWVTGVHLAASGLGVLWARRGAVAQSLPEWAPAALRFGARGFLWLLVLSGGLVVANMVAHWNRLAGGFGEKPGLVGLFGVLAVSLLYFPNIMLAGVDVLLGATVRLGGTSVGLAHAHIGQLPLLPVFSPFVSWHFGALAFGALVLPASVGAWLGSQCVSQEKGVSASVRAGALAAACAATLVLIGSALLCGQVGAIGRWSVDLPLVWGAGFLLLALPAVLVAAASAAPAALRAKRPEPVVVISPAREQSAWEEAEQLKEPEAEVAVADEPADGESLAAEPAAERATAEPEAEAKGQGRAE